MRASSKPSPTSTPLMAWMPMSAAASRASRRRSQWVYEPSPGGRPSTTTSTTPPSVSPSLWAASTSATMAVLVAASKQRTGSASSASTSEYRGTTPAGADTVPSSTTCDRTVAPVVCSTNLAATSPSATRAAVSRALARSRTGRASSKPYFCMPARSACPGRGRVSGAPRFRPSSTSGSTGSAAMTCSHLGHSLLPIRRATGLPIDTPCRRPPITSSSSASKLMRAPRP